MQDWLYQPFFNGIITLLTAICGSKLAYGDYYSIREGRDNIKIASLLCIFGALLFGYRPIDSGSMGDTGNYAQICYLNTISAEPIKGSGDTLWDSFMWHCAQHMQAPTFFVIVATGYFGFSLWACKRLTPNNVLVSLLFICGAFSFFSYGTNGIRNGLGASLTLFAFSYLTTGEKRDYIIGGIIALSAVLIHKAMTLPIGMLLLSIFWIKEFKTAYTFWLLAIPMSLLAGGVFQSVFSTIGFDSREAYFTSTENAHQFKHTGFRWDFLIYSMMPIVLGYYIVIKKKVEDRTYRLLLNTYTLTNAFWVLIIRGGFSNRFAYLSWFMYGLVLAYPLLRLDVWGDRQGMMLKRIMWAQLGFTLFMSIVYYG